MGLWKSLDLNKVLLGREQEEGKLLSSSRQILSLLEDTVLSFTLVCREEI
jgi:hypothetical protein